MSEETTDAQSNATQETSTQTQTNAEQTQQTDPMSTDAALKEPEHVVKSDLTLPKDALLGEDDVERIAEFAKEQGLSKEQAQAYLERENTMLAGLRDEQEAQVDKLARQWENEARADQEIGGDNFNTCIERSHRVLERFGSDSLKEQLNKTGLGNHPELIRMLSRIGGSMSEDQFIRGGSPVDQKPKSTAEVLYGETT